MIKIGVVCPSDIAFRRFLPSLQDLLGDFTFVGVAYATPEEWFGDRVEYVNQEEITFQQESELMKAQSIVSSYGGVVYHGYNSLMMSNEIDAVYIPLPPALHYHWSKCALLNGKHVFIEKPATTNIDHTRDLISIASDKGLAIHENYMFLFHKQIQVLSNVVNCGEIGEVRLYRISFGFPRRDLNDFRYNKELGGGSLLDAGGYTVKYASFLLGASARILTATLNHLPGFNVDMFGSATMINEDGVTAHLSFGMDNDYRCEIEIWGSLGSIKSDRILTAPKDYEPTYEIKRNQVIEKCKLPTDDSFSKSISFFKECITNLAVRKESYGSIEQQAIFISDIYNFPK